jgi:uncharacterized membrane protein YebE (DUF533 family)
MLDPKKLIEGFLRSKTGGMGGLGGLSGQSGLGGLGGKSGGKADWQDQLGKFAKDNPMAAGAIAAMVLGTGAGRKLGGSALRYGGMAAIAGLAYKAYQDYQSGAKPADTQQRQTELLPPPAGDSFDPAQAPQGEGEFALTLVRAMIAAAKSDGHIDETERQKIGDRLRLSGVDKDAEQFMMEELARPADVEALVAAAKTEAQKVELYTASRLAIDPDSRAERGYLDMLAGRLKLPDPLVDHIEATVSSVNA